MTTPFFWMLVALLLGDQAGSAVVKSLTEPLHHRPRYLALAGVCIVAGLAPSFRAQTALWLAGGLLALLAGLAIGYMRQARRFLQREDSRFVPELTRREGERGDGHAAVLFLARGEPENYDPTGLRSELRLLDRLDLPRQRFLRRPFLIAAFREGYSLLGRSEQRVVHRRMLKGLERMARSRGDSTTRFYPAYLDDEPRPDTAAIQALNEGASHLVILRVFVAETAYLRSGLEMIAALQVQDRFGVEVVATDPLADSERLQGLFAARTCAYLGDEEPAGDGDQRSATGVLLIGRGVPEARQGEAEFLAGAQEALKRAGFAPERVEMAWLEDAAYSPAASAERLIAAGARRILYCAATSSADGMMSRYEVPHALARAAIPPGVETVNLGAWNDDPIAVAALWEQLAGVQCSPAAHITSSAAADPR